MFAHIWSLSRKILCRPIYRIKIQFEHIMNKMKRKVFWYVLPCKIIVDRRFRVIDE
jgi:hypothetical protein